MGKITLGEYKKLYSELFSLKRQKCTVDGSRKLSLIKETKNEK